MLKYFRGVICGFSFSFRIMGFRSQVQRLHHHVIIRRLLLTMALIVAIVVSLQYCELPNKKMISWSPNDNGFLVMVIENLPVFEKSKSTGSNVVHAVSNHTFVSSLGEQTQQVNDVDLDFPQRAYHEGSSQNESLLRAKPTHEGMKIGQASSTDTSSTQENDVSGWYGAGEDVQAFKQNTNLSERKDQGLHVLTSLPLVPGGMSMKGMVNLDAGRGYSVWHGTSNSSSINDVNQALEAGTRNGSSGGSASVNNSFEFSRLFERQRRAPVSISQMNSILLQNYASSQPKKLKQFSSRDRELLFAKHEIENAPVIKKRPGLCASAFRNISAFIRSYELMEQILKVYIYREGEKPIFHQARMNGIYASEGWFMKLLEGNKRVTVRDPKKAHLFYLPFSSLKLRFALDGKNFHNSEDLQDFLGNYVDLISRRYPFWNRSRGADHFLVACHDWAPKLTKKLETCIRALCNANAARGFEIGRDTTLPVTHIKTSTDPLLNLGGKPPSERSLLAFFAGGMHGYLRPILLQYWENKEPDMKIVGRLPGVIEGKAKYREYMKSSKYCICAKGYEVHTPRVVEAIFFECVPVILSDNYVPPFFEVLDWEAFAVFVQEKDIPNLRNILLSIPQEKYLEMQSRLKTVQQHFLWHKTPVKYDLFHMILHSIWYNRVLQMRSR